MKGLINPIRRAKRPVLPLNLQRPAFFKQSRYALLEILQSIMLFSLISRSMLHNVQRKPRILLRIVISRIIWLERIQYSRREEDDNLICVG